MSPLYSGFLLCIGLIVSIGPQNAEILRIGTLGRPTFLLASVFVLCDAILVTPGAWGWEPDRTEQKCHAHFDNWHRCHVGDACASCRPAHPDIE